MKKEKDDLEQKLLNEFIEDKENQEDHIFKTDYYIYNIVLDKRKPGIAYLCDVEVFNEFRHQGYGIRLLNESVESAKILQCSIIQLHCEISNKIAYKLYTNFGFLEKEKYIDNCILMEKII